MKDRIIISGDVKLQDSINNKVDLSGVVGGKVGTFTPIYPPSYKGETTVVPSEETQVLDTKGFILRSDITVESIPSEYIIPSGKITVTANESDIDVSRYASLDVEVPSDPPVTQVKTATPTEEEQIITPDIAQGYEALSQVVVAPIPSNYGRITYDGSIITVS